MPAGSLPFFYHGRRVEGAWIQETLSPAPGINPNSGEATSVHEFCVLVGEAWPGQASLPGIGLDVNTLLDGNSVQWLCMIVPADRIQSVPGEIIESEQNIRNP